MSKMRGTILRREILFETSDRTRPWRIWLGKWDEDAVSAIEYLWMFSHRDSYGGDWAAILFKEGQHIVPADEFETAMLTWLNTKLPLLNANIDQHYLFIMQLWDLFFGVHKREREKIIFKRAWRWFIDHKAEFRKNPHIDVQQLLCFMS
jgi:hypothetical protein